MPLTDPIPPPLQLFRMLDAGRLSPEDFRAAMQTHARELIQEMEEDHRHPFAAALERLLNRRIVWKLTRQHGEALLREILLALAEVPDFPPGRWLWNAAHPHVPLHCFFRSRRSPVFRITRIEALPQVVNLTLEHGRGDALVTEDFKLRRDRRGQLLLVSRQPRS